MGNKCLRISTGYSLLTIRCSRSLSIRLPQLEPRIPRHLLVVHLVYESKLSGSRRTRIGEREDSLERFDIGDDPFGVHVRSRVLDA